MSSCIKTFYFNDTATTEIYTLPLHDALPISSEESEDSAREETEEPFGTSAVAEQEGALEEMIEEDATLEEAIPE